ncbi:hypothetical protein, partial [Paractinoplanes toevensis]|uniref:hypothetical protein n=1 Tax=Paractinoplanes toevensis TaxID=571911 RepID=UPI001BB37337
LKLRGIEVDLSATRPDRGKSGRELSSRHDQACGYPAVVRKRFEFVLALTPADLRLVEAVRADPSMPHREITAHAVRADSLTAVCGADVTPAAPKTDFTNDHIDEQWGPIHVCEPCSFGASTP